MLAWVSVALVRLIAIALVCVCMVYWYEFSLYYFNYYFGLLYLVVGWIRDCFAGLQWFCRFEVWFDVVCAA